MTVPPEKAAQLTTAETATRAAIAAAPDREACLRATVQTLHDHLPGYHWVGIYLLEGDTLVLGPFVGQATEHTRIPVGKGVCGRAVREGANQIVADVTADPAYLACSLGTRSEIVVLLTHGGTVLGQIDIDSDQPAQFDAADEAMLQRLADQLAARLAEGGSG